MAVEPEVVEVETDVVWVEEPGDPVVVVWPLTEPVEPAEVPPVPAPDPLSEASGAALSVDARAPQPASRSVTIENQLVREEGFMSLVR